jgi:glycosyltransferase involved in cell wall biosynthesis
LRSEFGFTSDDLVIGNIGRIGVQKGHSYLIEAVNIVRRELPNVKLLIVGTPEPDGTYEKLRSMVAQLGLKAHVVFTGYRDDIGSVLVTIDIFALPSLWEGFGLVLLEAMSMKKPIIASCVDSIPEIVQDGVQGILVPPRDVEALAQAILYLARSPELRTRMGTAGSRRVEQFSVQRMVDETVKLYDSLLSNRLVR